MRRTVAVVVPLLLAAAAPCLAGPVSSGRVAAASFYVQVSDRVTLDVALRALKGADGDRLMVSAQRCDVEAQVCDAPRSYEGVLPDGALVLDPSSAAGTLDVLLGVTRLQVTWAPDEGGPSAAVGGINGGGSGEDNAFTTYAGVPAATRVALPSGGCVGSGSVGDALRVATSDHGSGAARPLSALRLRARGAPHCGD